MQTQYASLHDADLRSALLSIHIRRVAIQFARARFLSRSRGDNVVRSAAYNERIAITADRTGELFYFKHRDPPAHHEVLLPEGAATKFAASAVLWNTRTSLRNLRTRSSPARSFSHCRRMPS